VIGTFALVLGVYGLAVNRKAPPGWAGLIIALNIAGLIIFLGNVSGAAINPARAFGPVFADWTLKVPLAGTRSASTSSRTPSAHWPQLGCTPWAARITRRESVTTDVGRFP
jgi:glycerol uptake facilitator-like aquaporin